MHKFENRDFCGRLVNPPAKLAATDPLIMEIIDYNDPEDEVLGTIQASALILHDLAFISDRDCDRSHFSGVLLFSKVDLDCTSFPGYSTELALAHTRLQEVVGPLTTPHL